MALTRAIVAGAGLAGGFVGAIVALVIGLGGTGGQSAPPLPFEAPPEVTRQPQSGQDRLPLEIELGADFRLIDQNGVEQGRDDLQGQLSLVFFGFANCEGVCLTALPHMGDAVALLERQGARVRPVLITIDPDRDTPEVLGRKLVQYHPRFVGLTGSEAALGRARATFHVRRSVLFQDPAGAPVYQHGTFVYLLGRDAEFLTVFPPVLAPEDMAAIVRNYL